MIKIPNIRKKERTTNKYNYFVYKIINMNLNLTVQLFLRKIKISINGLITSLFLNLLSYGHFVYLRYISVLYYDIVYIRWYFSWIKEEIDYMSVYIIHVYSYHKINVPENSFLEILYTFKCGIRVEFMFSRNTRSRWLYLCFCARLKSLPRVRKRRNSKLTPRNVL